MLLLVAGATLGGCAVVCGGPADSGPAVGSFTVQPVETYEGAYRNHSLNTWGGALLHDRNNGEYKYHMFASAFVEGCGLHAWETNSEIVHLVSTSMREPFVFHDVALPPWHHGVGAAQHTDGTYLLFSMGTTNTSAVVPCPEGVPLWPSTQNCTPPVCTGFNVRGHSSPSLNGPWTPIENIDSASTYFGTNILWNAVNADPSPWVLPNGTVVVVGGGLYSAPHWKGPYRQIPGPRYPQPSKPDNDPRLKGGRPAAEDPYLWYMDGRWRQMWHQKLDSPTNSTGNHNPCSYFPYVGGYAVANTPGIDGLSGLWEKNFFEPGYGLNVSLTNGSSFCLSRRERPKIVEIEGKMWLTNGAMIDGEPGDGPGDQGTYTFLQEVLRLPNYTTAVQLTRGEK